MDLYRNPANRFVATFLGSPAINLLPGTWADGASRLRAAGAEVPMAAGRYETLCRAALFGGVQGAPRRVEVGIRPEDVLIDAPGSAGSPGLKTRPTEDKVGSDWHQGTVLVVEPMGNETLVTLERDGARLVARAPSDIRLEPSAPVWFAFAPDRALFFDADTGKRL